MLQLLPYFIHFERATGQNLAVCIVSMLTKLGLPIEDMRGQAYDGAAAVSSCNVGVQANMKRLNPWLSTSIAIIEKMVGYINDVFLFYHLPPKRQRFLENKRRLTKFIVMRHIQIYLVQTDMEIKERCDMYMAKFSHGSSRN